METLSEIDENKKMTEMWEPYPASTPTLQLIYAAHPATTDIPHGSDGTTSWLKCLDAGEEWCELTKTEAKRKRSAIATKPSGRAKLFRSRLDKKRLKDPEAGVEYYLVTMRLLCVTDRQTVFMYRFFQTLRCDRGQTSFQ